MCLAIPMMLIDRNELAGVAEVGGVKREIALVFVPDAVTGEYVLVHAGYAITTVDQKEAADTLELLREYANSMAEL